MSASTGSIGDVTELGRNPNRHPDCLWIPQTVNCKPWIPTLMQVLNISGNWEWLTFENTSWRNWEGSCVRETEHWERICIEGKKCGVIYEACGSDGILSSCDQKAGIWG